MKKYFIEKCEREFKLRGFFYEPFCTYGEGDIFNEKISKSFETKEEVLIELKKYNSVVKEYPSNKLVYVTEYAAVLEEYDENNEFITHDIIKIAPLIEDDQNIN